MSSTQTGSTRPRAWREATIEAAITRERMRSYMAAASGDLGKALELYNWNARAAGSVLQTTALVEVLSRNAPDRGMVAWADAKRRYVSWFDAAPRCAVGVARVTTSRRLDCESAGQSR
jgi:hypothetical protein